MKIIEKSGKTIDEAVSAALSELNVSKEEVEIEVDALPNHTFKGIVSSVSRATGSSFSLMPQDNSSGNFVKIEQRIPIRIDFTEDNDAKAMECVSVGMNVECKVLY